MSFNKLTDILLKLQKHYPVLQTRIEEAKALNHWTTAVGEGIAKHARAIRVENGILRVEVDHPIWKSELHHRKRQIIERLNELAKNSRITDILFY